MIKIIVSIILILAISAFGQNVQKIIKEVQDKYEDIKYFSAEFVQKDHYKLTGSVNEVMGKIKVKDGIKYRLITEDQFIITDGKTTWSFSKISNQVIVDNVKEGDASLIPRDMIFRYPKEYITTFLKMEEINGMDFYVIRMDPGEKVHRYIKTMKIWVHKDTYLIHKLEYTDFNGNTSSFKIKNIDIESKLNDSLFFFDPPEGIEVVDMRK